MALTEECMSSYGLLLAQMLTRAAQSYRNEDENALEELAQGRCADRRQPDEARDEGKAFVRKEADRRSQGRERRGLVGVDGGRSRVVRDETVRRMVRRGRRDGGVLGVLVVSRGKYWQ